jgi:hypothetical protein
MDGRFVTFAITDDRSNTVLKWYYFIGTASNSHTQRKRDCG